MAPTRELAMQIEEEFKKLVPYFLTDANKDQPWDGKLCLKHGKLSGSRFHDPNRPAVRPSATPVLAGTVESPAVGM